ncbi:MAG: hypothetical protein R2709_14350 [Marmoricola sp.]
MTDPPAPSIVGHVDQAGIGLTGSDLAEYVGDRLLSLTGLSFRPADAAAVCVAEPQGTSAGTDHQLHPAWSGRQTSD